MIDELSKICLLKSDIDLTNYNTYKLHSIGKYIMFPNNINELISILNVIKKHNYKYLILGNGSNVILPDYYDGLIIKLNNFNNFKIESDYVYAECGCMVNKLSNELVNKGYSCLEWASGIPGSIGGCIYNNAGAYNSSISDVLISALVYDGKEIKEYTNKKIKFEYRDSIFKKNRNLIILSCKLKIAKSDKKELKDLVIDRANRRMQTQDLTHPSCGSVFRNPESAPAGKLIDDLGLKGYSINGAMVSKIHANFIINNGNAKQKDIIDLINEIKFKVKKEYDIDLILEQEIIK
jgi:UDP-N-acetylmuramate dehydrogenase